MWSRVTLSVIPVILSVIPVILSVAKNLDRIERSNKTGTSRKIL